MKLNTNLATPPGAASAVTVAVTTGGPTTGAATTAVT